MKRAASRPIARSALAAIGAAAAGVLLVATPPENATPPAEQIRVAPLGALVDEPAEVLVPADLGRALGPFLAILETEGADPQSVVWQRSHDGNAYEPAP